VPIQVFVDDSGMIGQGPYFVMAGLIGRAEQWSLFSDDWKKCLNASPRIGQLKMRDAAARGGDFYGFSEKERNQKLIDLLGVIDAHRPTLLDVVLDLSAFDDTIRNFAGKPHNNPYFIGYLMMMLAVAYELLDRGARERFEAIFDEHEQLAPQLKKWYPILRSMALVEEKVRAILPVDPLFRSDDEFMPLQACDLFAWWSRQFHERYVRGEADFLWLMDHLPRIGFSEHSQFVDRERMQNIVQDARNMGFQVPLLIKKEMRRQLGEEK